MIASVWNVQLRRNSATAVGTGKKSWLHRVGRGGSTWRCVSLDVEIPFVQCFEDVKYKKAFGQLVAATQEVAMAETPSATELV